MVHTVHPSSRQLLLYHVNANIIYRISLRNDANHLWNRLKAKYSSITFCKVMIKRDLHERMRKNFCSLFLSTWYLWFYNNSSIVYKKAPYNSSLINSWREDKQLHQPTKENNSREDFHLPKPEQGAFTSATP